MAAAETFTTKVQGTVLTLVRGSDDPLVVGQIMNFTGLSSPLNDIPIGSWEDTEIETRPGRPKLGDASFDIFFNPDEEVQQALKEMEGTDEEGEWALIHPEGTETTRTFMAMVALFGDSAKDDNVYTGQITLSVTTTPERT